MWLFAGGGCYESGMTTTTDDERIASLRAIPLFRELNDGILRRVLERASEFDVRRGHVLIERVIQGKVCSSSRMGRRS